MEPVRYRILLPKQSYRWARRKHYQDGEKQRGCRSKQQEDWKKHKRNSSINQFFSVRDNLSVIDNVIYMNDLFVLSYALREDVVKTVHEMGQLGETKGLNLLQQNVWWPGCSSAMKEAVRKCHECQIVQKQYNIEPMKPEMLQEGPVQKVAVNFKGPFKAWFLFRGRSCCQRQTRQSIHAGYFPYNQYQRIQYWSKEEQRWRSCVWGYIAFQSLS